MNVVENESNIAADMLADMRVKMESNMHERTLAVLDRIESRVAKIESDVSEIPYINRRITTLMEKVNAHETQIVELSLSSSKLHGKLTIAASVIKWVSGLIASIILLYIAATELH